MVSAKRTAHVRKLIFLLLWFLGLLLSAPAALLSQTTGEGAIHIMEVRGVINPPVVIYIQRALEEAATQNARLVVIQIDTPGGLDTSTREITQAILASPVP